VGDSQWGRAIVRRLPPARVARLALTFAAAAAAIALAPASAFASSVTLFAVSSGGAGSGPCTSAASACTLSWALTEAASSGSTVDVTIDLAASGGTPYSGFSIESGSEHSLTLDGAGETTTDISGGGTPASGPLVEVDEPGQSIKLMNLEISGGNNTGSYGGDLGLDGGTVTLSNAWVADGVDTFSDGLGGGMEIGAGTVTIENSKITGNSAGTISGDGGGIMTFDGTTLTLEDSTVSGNTAVNGSAIHTQGTVNIEDSTIASNTGGDALDNAGGTVGVYGSTIDDNPYGIINGSGTFDLGASILASNGPGHDCDGGTITDEGYNYADDSSCSGFSGTSRDSASPLDLGVLGFNGGPNDTMPITSSSLAYDVVPTGTTLTGESHAFCSGDDQRGVPRTQGSATHCDSGAYQYAPPIFTTTSLPAGQVGVAYSSTLAASDTFTPLTFALVSGSLPPGLSLSSAGVISGTPTSATSATVGVQASDPYGVTSGTDTLSINIAAAPVSTPPKPVIALESSTVKLKHGKLPASISCSAAPCSGDASLTESVKVKVKHHTKTETVTLASASYSLTTGQTATVKLSLTAKGRHALANVSKHHLHETLIATVTGGTTVSTRVEVT